MTSNMINQYYNSPKSFAEIRKLYLSFPNTSLKFRLRHTIHFVSSSILSKNKSFYKEIDDKKILLLALPFGFILSTYIRLKVGVKRG